MIILIVMILSFLYDVASLYAIFIVLLLLIIDFDTRVILFLIMICLRLLIMAMIVKEGSRFLRGFGKIIKRMGPVVYFIHCLLNLLCLFSMVSNLC